MSDPVSISKMFADFRKVARGLSLVFTSYVIRITAVFFGGILAVVFTCMGNPALLLLVLFFIGLLFLIGKIMAIIGRSQCLAIPEGTWARTYIWSTVTLDLLSIGLFVAMQVFDLPKGGVGILLLSGELLSLFCFVVFLRHTAELIQNDRLASRANAVILNAVFIGCSFVAFVVFIYWLPMNGQKGGVAALCSTSTVFGMMFVVLIQYANLIRNVGRGIEDMVDAATRHLEQVDDSLD
jgi:hypothetical protein